MIPKYLFYRKHERNTSVWLKEGLSRSICIPRTILMWILILMTNLCHLWRNHLQRSQLHRLLYQVLLLKRLVYLTVTGNKGWIFRYFWLKALHVVHKRETNVSFCYYFLTVKNTKDTIQFIFAFNLQGNEILFDPILPDNLFQKT